MKEDLNNSVINVVYDPTYIYKRNHKSSSAFIEATKIYSEAIKSAKKKKSIQEVKITNTEGVVVINKFPKPYPIPVKPRVYVSPPKKRDE